MSLIEPHHQNCMYRYVAPDGYAEQYQDAWFRDLAVRRGQETGKKPAGLLRHDQED